MLGSSFTILPFKRLFAAACLVLAAVSCGDDDDGNSKPNAAAAGEGGDTAGSSGGANAGGADGQGASAGAPTTFSGVVAGYVQGATAFLDLNENFALDDDEPSGTTNAKGEFSLELRGDVDPERFPVVALIPDDAIDSYTEEPVSAPYLIAAPAGANAFVSPLSSLVSGLLLRYPSFSLEEGEQAIRAKLGAPDELSLFADYVADSRSSSETAAESQKLERAARVVGMSFGIDLQVIGAEVATIDAFTLITHNAEQQLATLAPAVASDESTNDDLLAVATFLKHVEKASLEARLDRSQRASRADVFDIFAARSSIPFPGPNGAVAGFADIEPSTDDRDGYSLPQQDYSWDLDTEKYVAEPPIFDAGFSLTKKGWVARTEKNATLTFASNADGSADQSSSVSRAAQHTTANAVDLSGRLLRSYAKGIDFTDRDARFPKGSVGYRLAVNSGADEYLASDIDDLNSDLYELTSLDDIETMYGAGGAFFRTSTALSIQLSNEGVATFTSGRDDMLLPLRGSWRRATVDGAELIEVSVPVAYKSEFDFLDASNDLFLAVVDGHGRSGVVTRSGIADTQDYYLLNQKAFAAVQEGAVANDDGVPVFGKVAAGGWLDGATVFLDLDDNGRFDAGEPYDISRDGEYALFWSKADFEEHSIAAQIPANASVYLPDKNQAYAVTQAFSLRAPIGETFVSPYSTLGWYALESGEAKSFAVAEADLATTLGTSAPLDQYVEGADETQQKVRFVAAIFCEKLQEARARMLSNMTGADSVVLHPDDIGIYRSLVGANFTTLASTVASVEALLAEPTPSADGNLNDFVDREAWSNAAEEITSALFDALFETLYLFIKKMIVVVVAEIAGYVGGEVPYIGWLLGPMLKCGILESNGIECGAV